MRWRNPDVWRHFTYELVYPAVLGSMLYDLLNVHDFTLDAFGWPGPAKWFTSSLALFYALDWLYLYEVLPPPKEKSSPVHMLVDIPIALCLGFSFHLALNNNIGKAYFLWFLASSFILVYHFVPRLSSERPANRWYTWGILALIPGTTAAGLCLYSRPSPRNCITDLFPLIPLGLYFLYIFLYSRLLPKESLPSGS